MDIIKDKYYEVSEFYDWALSISDPRVKDWFLMQSIVPTLVTTIAYIVIVLAGMKFMEKREPVKLGNYLFYYNIALVILNLHIFTQVSYYTTKAGYNYSCQKVVYTDDENELQIAKALWWFYFSKCLEMLDTIFFVLRKKNNQVSFLHVYHHASMFPLWWIGVKWVAGGQSFFGAMINSFIHVVMYGYYGLSALGPHMQKYLWWKRYLTMMQLIQFVVGITHAAQSLFMQCEFPMWMQWALVFYAFTILCLFLNFYFHAYIKSVRRKASKKESNGTVKSSEANGHISNDKPATNGHVETKKHK
ncbi:elongation of very long chain fatty acids protein 4-like isoform X2 [Mytilus californianus]|uniref:elongation of very long chain fatty acids protein 4-like isoform X2 n=1 Tax=Mytilus californianus TaxID=6549 RepID=UPI00224634C8|nr:elongation of very long chain fatty acids protein 4-like isoform X2 [Mytilus californianus]